MTSEQPALIPPDDQPPVEYKPSACAVSLDGEAKVCKFCRKKVLRGRTTKGNISWFDPEPDPDGRNPNHWVTCPERAAAAREFKRAKR